MTVYSVKINKHEVVKTTALHEALNLAKKALKDKIAAKGLYPSSVCEKVHILNGKVCYRVYATVYEKGYQGITRIKTYSNAVRMEDISEGMYNFALHKEFCDAVTEAKNDKGALEKFGNSH